MSSFSIPSTRLPYRSRLGWLPISLAVNLLLIGLVLAWVWHMPAAPRQPLITWQREMIPLLSPADAVLANEATGGIAGLQASGDDAVHAQYGRIRALLAVEPVDQAALQAAFTEIANIRHSQQVAIGEIFRRELTTVSPEGRRIILATMEKQSQRWHASPGH